ATMGDMATCVGPPDTIILGSVGVFIGGKPAARMGDSCAHGGMIMIGCPTVLIGEVGAAGGGGGAPGVSAPAMQAMQQVAQSLPPEQAAIVDQTATLIQAAAAGTPFCEQCT
ncbi:MAG TPA: PAAR domain-containing protein, partial [Phnomibacter sp.]|nr:PAAR domain-containing protein [Phnomibacter sp.]